MTIEIGKTYKTRDGEAVTITGETDNRIATYRMIGHDDRGRVTFRSRKGRFDAKPSRLDLIAEVTD